MVTIEVEHTRMPKQREFMECDAPAVLYSGAWRAGKSRALCFKLVSRAIRPGAREGLCRKHLVTLKATTLKTLLEPDGDLPPVLPEGTYHHNKLEREIKIHGGGTIYYFGFGPGENSSQKIGSHGWTGCAVDEAVELTELNWMWCRGRLSVEVEGLPRQLYGACNPGPPSHFLAEKFGLALAYKPKKGHVAIQTKSSDNRHLPADYMEWINELTGVAHKRYVLGLWVGSEGLVYDNWNRDVNVCHRPGPWKRTIVGQDAGYTNPAVILVLCEDSDGRLHVAEEWYKTKQLEPAVIEQAETYDDLYEPDLWHVDPSDPGLIAALRHADINAVGAENAIFDGCQTVRARLSEAGDGKPRLTVDPSCENLIREMETYENKIDQKTGTYTDEPVKANDHAMDALRYAVVAVDGLEQLVVREFGVKVRDPVDSEERFWR